MATTDTVQPPVDLRQSSGSQARDSQAPSGATTIAIALLTGGSDKPYVFGLASELLSKSIAVDVIGSDELECLDFGGHPKLRFLNLRGDQSSEVNMLEKLCRVGAYYTKLIRYAATAKPKIFHILWNNRFEYFDRTLLMLYYKLLGRKVVLTAHNVNAGRRDRRDSFLNRLTLRIQYRLADHLFVHTEKMKRELIDAFGVAAERVTVIPLGINNAVPVTDLTADEAKRRLGVHAGEKVVLFFGRISPYKGLDILVRAFQLLLTRHEEYRLFIAGRPDNCDSYWAAVKESIQKEVEKGRVLLRPEFIPDAETEVYFKAADVLVLPYRDIYQSGVLFLGYSFGLPALVADVGSLPEEVAEGQTGFVFRREDPVDLAETIERYFASELYKDLKMHRRGIQDYATVRNTWGVVGREAVRVYAGLGGGTSGGDSMGVHDAP